MGSPPPPHPPSHAGFLAVGTPFPLFTASTVSDTATGDEGRVPCTTNAGLASAVIAHVRRDTLGMNSAVFFVRAEATSATATPDSNLDPAAAAAGAEVVVKQPADGNAYARCALVRERAVLARLRDAREFLGRAGVNVPQPLGVLLLDSSGCILRSVPIWEPGRAVVDGPEPTSTASVLSLLDGTDGAHAWDRTPRRDRLLIVREAARALRSWHDASLLPHGQHPSPSFHHPTEPGLLGIPLLRCALYRGSPPELASSASEAADAPAVSSSREWMLTALERFYIPLVTKRAASIMERDNASANEKSQAAEALQQLETMKAAASRPDLYTGALGDLVLVHGDFMLPNVLMQQSPSPDDDESGSGTAARGWRVSGLLDFGDTGFADRRYDLASMATSIEMNVRRAAARRKALRAGEGDNEVEKGDDDDDDDDDDEDVVSEGARLVREFLGAYGLPLERADLEPWAAAYDLFDFVCYEDLETAGGGAQPAWM
ncbi:hypothetical protein HK405_004419 [Cladochytrium tenue]|nr:hypothetical protein HK405_004419 [Cladochytrium tenue]